MRLSGLPAADSTHRSATHSVVTACFVLSVACALRWWWVHKHQHTAAQPFSLDAAASADSALTTTTTASLLHCSAECFTPATAHVMRWRYLHSTALGFFFGSLSHILCDLLLWFAPINVLWPISYAHSVRSQLSLWDEFDVPALCNALLSAAEMVCVALWMTCLRRRLTQYHHTSASTLSSSTSTSAAATSASAFASADSLEAQLISPPPSHSLPLTPPPLYTLLEAAHYLYFLLAVCLSPLISGGALFLVVFAPLLTVSVPCTVFWSWKWRAAIIRDRKL